MSREFKVLDLEVKKFSNSNSFYNIKVTLDTKLHYITLGSPPFMMLPPSYLLLQIPIN